MDNLTYVLHSVYAILGTVGLVAGLKALDWLIGLKYMSKDECNKKFSQIYSTIDRNKDETNEKLDKQYKEIIEKIAEQNDIFKEMAVKIAEISATNHIIMQKLGLK